MNKHTIVPILIISIILLGSCAKGLRPHAVRDTYPSIYPIKKKEITSQSNYGMRNGRMHSGQDLAAPKGTYVFAAAKGIVTYAKRNRKSGYGKMIIIKHDSQYSSVYAHLSRIRVKVGKRVKKGQFIGKVGNTGRSTGPHLHYEVRVNDKPVDPRPYLQNKW
ncbi:MAG: M23 family metallopeptidase [Bacteroidales bacterium]